MKTNLNTALFIPILYLFAFAALTAKATDRSSYLLVEYDRLFARLDSLILKPSINSLYFGDTYNIFRPAEIRKMSPELDIALIKRTQAEIHEGNSQTGLSITGQTYFRLDNDLGFDEDDAESRYRFKIQGELRWNFLQSSLFGRKGRRKEATLKELIDRENFCKQRSDVSDYKLRQNLRHYYDSLMAGVLQHRLRALNLINDTQSYLLSNQNITSDDLLPILDARMEAERKLAAIDGTYPYANDLSRPEGYIVRIDTTALMRHIRNTQIDLTTLRLQMELLEQQASNTTYWRQINLSPFVRYSYYGRTDLPNSKNIDVGMTFSVPINNETHRKRQNLRAERNVIGAQEAYIQQRITDKVSFICRELDRLNRESEAEGKRIVEMKKYIAMRTDAYRNRIGEFNRLARTREYNLYLSCLERLIDYQYRRDTYLAELQTLVPDISIMKFCLSIPLHDTISRNRQ